MLRLTAEQLVFLDTLLFNKIKEQSYYIYVLINSLTRYCTSRKKILYKAFFCLYYKRMFFYINVKQD